MENEAIKKMIDEAPDRCPITGLVKIEAYVFDEGVVYGTYTPNDAYTLAEYEGSVMEFSHTKIDMDDEFTREHMTICELFELVNRDDFNEIVAFYNIPNEHVEKAREEYKQFNS